MLFLGKYGIAYFRTADCTGVDGAFKHFRSSPEQVTKEDRARSLAVREELLDLCATSLVTAFGITIDMADFRSVADTPEKMEAFGGTPYYHAASLAMVQAAQHIKEHRPSDILAFGFDEHDVYAKELSRVYRELKESKPDIAPYLSTCAPFDDKVFIPVQVADLFASIIRRFGFQRKRTVGVCDH